MNVENVKVRPDALEQFIAEHTGKREIQIFHVNVFFNVEDAIRLSERLQDTIRMYMIQNPRSFAEDKWSK